MMWVVYLLHWNEVFVPMAGRPGSRDTYVGMSNRLEHRLKQHNAGMVKATRGRAWHLAAFVVCADRNHAAQVERWLKCGDTRRKRQTLALHADTECRVQPQIETAVFDAVQLWQIKRDHKVACMVRDNLGKQLPSEREGDTENV